METLLPAHAGAARSRSEQGNCKSRNARCRRKVAVGTGCRAPCRIARGVAVRCSSRLPEAHPCKRTCCSRLGGSEMVSRQARGLDDRHRLGVAPLQRALGSGREEAPAPLLCHGVLVAAAGSQHGRRGPPGMAPGGARVCGGAGAAREGAGQRGEAGGDGRAVAGCALLPLGVAPFGQHREDLRGRGREARQAVGPAGEGSGLVAGTGEDAAR
mmetsp:Transcript_2118/g.8254  ORF Transcript_2118/g.8254 Transcript_2118/m.8254 type:complete len:213 (-) Transcript_2118:1026-1664(-)